jgi:hypothetical protein
MDKASKLQYKYAKESLDTAIDNLFTIVDVDDTLSLEEKESLLREIWLLVSVKHGMGGK